jgi:hypothetical protein
MFLLAPNPETLWGALYTKTIYTRVAYSEENSNICNEAQTT